MNVSFLQSKLILWNITPYVNIAFMRKYLSTYLFWTEVIGLVTTYDVTSMHNRIFVIHVVSDQYNCLLWIRQERFG